MSLEQAIHARWAADGTLTALIPAARFVTGKALGGLSLPYAVLSRVGQQQVTRTSSRRVAHVRIRFDAFSADLGTLRQVADAVEARFDRQSFSGGKDDESRELLRELGMPFRT